METAVNVPVSALALIVGRPACCASAAPAAWLGFGLVFAVFALGPSLRAFGWAWPVAAAPLRPADAGPRPQRHARARPFHDGWQHRVRAQRRDRRGGPPGTRRPGGPVARPARRWCSRSWNAGRACGRKQRCRPSRPSTPRSRADVAPSPCSICPMGGPVASATASPRTCTSRRFTASRSPGPTSRATTRGSRSTGSTACGTPNVTDHRATRVRLRALGYRYVVWHKHTELFAGGRVAEGADGVPRRDPTPASVERRSSARRSPANTGAR